MWKGTPFSEKRWCFKSSAWTSEAWLSLVRVSNVINFWECLQRLLLRRRQSSEIMNHYSLSPRYFDAVAWENVCKRYLGAACTLEDTGYLSIWGMVADSADWYVLMVEYWWPCLNCINRKFTIGLYTLEVDPNAVPGTSIDTFPDWRIQLFCWLLP